MDSLRWLSFGDTTVPYTFVRDTRWSEETTMQGDPVSKDGIHTHNEKDIRRLPLCHSGLAELHKTIPSGRFGARGGETVTFTEFHKIVYFMVLNRPGRTTSENEREIWSNERTSQFPPFQNRHTCRVCHSYGERQMPALEEVGVWETSP